MNLQFRIFLIAVFLLHTSSYCRPAFVRPSSPAFEISISRLYPVMDKFFYPSPPYYSSGTRVWTYPFSAGFTFPLQQNAAFRFSVGYEHIAYEYWIDWGGLDVSFIDFNIRTIPLYAGFRFQLPTQSNLKPFLEIGPSISLIANASLDEDHREWNTNTKKSADITEHITPILGLKIGSGLALNRKSVTLSFGINYFVSFQESIVKSSIVRAQLNGVTQPTDRPVDGKYRGLSFSFSLGFPIKMQSDSIKK